ncbi:hemolysin XhlA [Rahnella sp. ChDrAdgB13]|uniref:hemolysin XhlA n=1 Tax=Rahnella sp. ChDrAdgB13 TaxID=1850581 RepID=UPI001FCAE604|nr:hemolysin XhlA [Rahnella sp. ChDrAdgB13]
MSAKLKIVENPDYLFPEQVSNGGTGGGGNMMDERIKKLEESMNDLKSDIAVIKSNYASKEDIATLRTELHKSISGQTKWLAATLLGTTGLALAIAKYIF